MPPEQLNPRKDATVLPTTDIFSFGVMMFQIITGKLPFGPLAYERDLVPYIRNGKAGEWSRKTLESAPGGKDWLELIEGCLVPDFHHRLQKTEDVLALVPHYGSIRPAMAEQPKDYRTKIVNGVLLRVMQGEDYGMVYRLDDMLRGDNSILRMGRMDDGVYNDIAIREDASCYISRKHCTLELDYEIGSWVVRDGQWDRSETGGWRKSTNGTYVNSMEATTKGLPFKPGDIISIGDTKLRAEAY